ncbi:MAG: T9SS type A sorting domain-containing protein [Bacteroidetes bacterium]|nr:T9SS type A sorting domain-containing protein [Bacteroidota bacterium]
MALLRTFLAGTTGPGLRSPLTALLLPAAIGASAQLFSSSASITITTGADVHVQGGLLNHGNGVVSNDGTLYVSGDLTHDATGTCFGASAGEVVLDGGAQSIGGVSGIVFNDLTLAGTGDKTLLRDTEVGGAYPGPAGVLQLSDRRLLLNSHTLAVHTGSSTAVQRTTGFIVSETDPLLGYGTLRWDIGQQAVAGNEFVFPFGNAVSGDYLPVSVTITDPGTGVNGWLALSAYPTDPTPSPNNRPLPTGLSVLTDLGGTENAPSVLDRWWVMATGGYAQAPVADLRFTYRDSEWNSGLNLITEATLMLQDLWNGVWQHPPSVVSPVANTLSTTGRTLRNGPWTAATAGSPLPIELLAFTGERVDAREVMLRWSTATEQDNAGFEVWRMIEGEEGFRQVGWVDGAGDSQAKLDYTLPDDNPTRYVSYYKLRQVDLDGQSAWSPTVAVLGTSTEGRCVLFPNPANDRFFVDTDPDGIRSVLLLDGSGRRVKEWSWQPQGFTVDDLPAGLYTVVLAGTDGGTRQQKLMIGR